MDNPLSLIAFAYDQLEVGGHLIISFPHRDLYEKRLDPPSTFAKGHRHFYTVDRLLLQVQSACGINSARLRFAKDYDWSHDYNDPHTIQARGGYSTIVVLEKTGRNERFDDIKLVPISRARDYAGLENDMIAAGNVSSILSASIGIDDVEKILVLKLDHLGDFAMMVPNFLELRSMFPAAEVTLVCGSWNIEMAQSLDIFERVVSCDYYKEDEKFGGRTDQEKSVQAQKLGAMFADEEFDLAIDFRVPIDSRRLLGLINARVRAGVGSASEFPFLDIALPSLEALLQDTRHVREAAELSWNPLAFNYDSPHSVRDGVAVCNPSDRRWFISGPYTKLAAGRYRGRFNLRLFGKHNYDLVVVECDVAADVGKILFAKKFSVTEDASRCEFDFVAFVDLPEVEFRVRIAEMPPAPPAFVFLGVTMTFLGATPARRLVPPASIHIAEHITLLLALIRSRLFRAVDTAELRRKLAASDSAGAGPRYVVLAPFSNSFLRDWPSEQYVHLGCAILERTDAKVVLLGSGSQKQFLKTVAEQIEPTMGAEPRVEVATGLGMPKVFEIVSSAVTTITNNSGLAHVASMLGVRSISIYSYSHQVVEWGPIGEQSAIMHSRVECGPCAYDKLRECLHGHRCMRIISYLDVLTVLERQATNLFEKKDIASAIETPAEGA